ncbi:MAG: ABC transporter ATP-binding protein [Gammaproteobacteria bacterium]|nr:ABC transporter ATP-binding protein [Gammaproteobacteria bacterium]
MTQARPRNLWFITRGQRARYLAAVLAMGVSNLFMLSSPLVGMYALDALSADDLEQGAPGLAETALAIAGVFGGTPVIAYLIVSALAGVLVTALGGLFLYLRGRWAAMASEAIARKLRDALYERLHHLPASFFDTADTGDLVQRCSSDVETVRMFLSAQVVEIGRAVLLLAIMTPMLFWRDERLAMLSVCLMPFIVLGAVAFFTRVKRVFLEVDESEAAMTAVLQENLTGIRVVRAFARQEFEIKRFGERNAAFRNNYFRMNRLMGLYWGVSDLFCMAQITIVLIAGGAFLAAGTITVGELFAFITLVGMVLWPVRHLGRVLTDTGKAMVALKRINHILETEEETQEPVPEIGRARGDLAFEDLTFGYEPKRFVLREVSVAIPAGQTVGIVGAPGSGKSTLIRLLLRLYSFAQGRITLDGLDITQVDRKWLRAQVGVVLQDPFLYSRSIEENLRVARPDAPVQDLIDATRDAAIHQAIEDFPAGYDSLVGERGVTLSGGQRQRLALARALLKDPPVLVLDDSLSAVDTGTELAILAALRRRQGRHTTLVIAHRLSSVRDADRILVLDEGQLVQDGDHRTLAALPGPYRRLCEIQGALDESIDADLHNARARQMQGENRG